MLAINRRHVGLVFVDERTLLFGIGDPHAAWNHKERLFSTNGARARAALALVVLRAPGADARKTERVIAVLQNAKPPLGSIFLLQHLLHANAAFHRRALFHHRHAAHDLVHHLQTGFDVSGIVLEIIRVKAAAQAAGAFLAVKILAALHAARAARLGVWAQHPEIGVRIVFHPGLAAGHHRRIFFILGWCFKQICPRALVCALLFGGGHKLGGAGPLCLDLLQRRSCLGFLKNGHFEVAGPTLCPGRGSCSSSSSSRLTLLRVPHLVLRLWLPRPASSSKSWGRIHTPCMLLRNPGLRPHPHPPLLLQCTPCC
eukprot:m.107343 g.107343  ORF g.107343 m.107343 type:complete len:313 (-) comp14249_c1_seq5:373-1311(-)